ncbi:MAG: KGK domain-containing protein [Cyanophyceae cyanobacterium]
MPSEQLDLSQYPEGILSVGEKNFKIATLLKAAQEDLAKKEELNRLFISALRTAGILAPDDLLNMASSLISPKPEESILQETKWFREGLICQILIPGKKEWQVGKVKLRITIDFETDMTKDPSSLDDLRS